MSPGQTGHITGQMGRVPGTDRTHSRGCPAKILYVYWFFLSPKFISTGLLLSLGQTHFVLGTNPVCPGDIPGVSQEQPDQKVYVYVPFSCLTYRISLSQPCYTQRSQGPPHCMINSEQPA